MFALYIKQIGVSSSNLSQIESIGKLGQSWEKCRDAMERVVGERHCFLCLFRKDWKVEKGRFDKDGTSMLAGLTFLKLLPSLKMLEDTQVKSQSHQHPTRVLEH